MLHCMCMSSDSNFSFFRVISQVFSIMLYMLLFSPIDKILAKPNHLVLGGEVFIVYKELSKIIFSCPYQNQSDLNP